jgi:hypothetical protein
MRWMLGLDISTSCTGVCLLAEDCSDVILQPVVLSNIQDTFCKARAVREEMLRIKQGYEISGIFIEENLQSFRRGLSSAQTINTLARFNGIVSYIVEETFGISPTFINATKARSSLSIPIDRKRDESVKVQVFEWVRGQLPSYSWPLKKGRESGKDSSDFREIAMDMSDAYVLCRAGLIPQTPVAKITKPKKRAGKLKK